MLYCAYSIDSTKGTAMYTLDINDDTAIEAIEAEIMDNRTLEQVMFLIRGAERQPNEHNNALAAKARQILTGADMAEVVRNLDAAYKRQRQTGALFA